LVLSESPSLTFSWGGLCGAMYGDKWK